MSKPTCDICRRERTDEDWGYEPLQTVLGHPLGWYSDDDGEVCGDCFSALMGRGDNL